MTDGKFLIGCVLVMSLLMALDRGTARRTQ